MALVDYDVMMKILMIGDSAVGKSSILLKYIDGEFRNSMLPTIGVDYKMKTVDNNGKKVKLQIWDTAGQESFQSITRSYFRSSAGALLVFDITSKQSFHNIQNWLEEARMHGNDKMSFCLVANKSDLSSE